MIDYCDLLNWTWKLWEKVNVGEWGRWKSRMKDIPYLACVMPYPG